MYHRSRRYSNSATAQASQSLDWASKEGFIARIFIASSFVFPVVVAPFTGRVLEGLVINCVALPVMYFCMMPFVNRPAAFSGAATALALYPIGYAAYLVSINAHRNGMEWIWYIFSLPGPLIGATLGAVVIRKFAPPSAFRSACLAALSTFVGIAVGNFYLDFIEIGK